MSTKSFSETITTRYNKEHQKVYNEVMDIVNKDSVTKSTAQLLLVERGLVHTNNPEPLIKEVEKKVYVDRPIEKVVYRDKIVYKDTQKDTPLSVNKATQQETPTSKNSGWLWLLGSVVTGVGVLVGWKYLAHKNGNNGAPLADPYAYFYQQFGASKQHKNSPAIAPR